MDAFVERARKKLNKKKDLALKEKKPRKPKLKSERKKSSAEKKPGVIYVGRIPHGFYEKQMQEYFSQFGKVTRVRLARSKASRNSKGYAYVEFEYNEVAKIAAEAMNNYLLFDKILKCDLVSGKQSRRNLFRGYKKSMPTTREQDRWMKEREKSSEVLALNAQTRIKKLHRLKEYLEAKGIDFNIDPLISK